MDGHVLLASGREADVFALDEARVLRRYRHAVMAYVAAAGYPVPLVYDADGPDLVLERLDGETLLDALLAGRIDTGSAAELLATLHDRLHSLPARLSTEPTDRVLHLAHDRWDESSFVHAASWSCPACARIGAGASRR